MSASFTEKSVWIQLVSMVLVLGGYFVLAAPMLAGGASPISSFVPLFAGSIVIMVVLLVAGHVAIAVGSQPDGRDERDRLIEWRAGSNAAWVAVAGVLVALGGLVMSVDGVWIAHLLLLSLFLAGIWKFLMQIYYYRRGT